MAEQKKQTVEELLAEVARLQAALAGETKARTEAEEMAMAVASASPFMHASTEEQPSGNTIKINKCTNPWERNEKKQVFKDIDVPTFFYTIDLPAGAGISLSTNGVEYYHGQTYEFDLFTLSDIKHRVARTWDHEKSIHGDNENAYRRTKGTHLMTAAAASRQH